MSTSNHILSNPQRHCRSLYRMFDTELGVHYKDYTTRPYTMYHAGTEDDVKSYITQSMTSSDGTVRVLFATTAFGMGVDCKDLRLVVHFGPPSDIDDYCQEFGRAGSDQQRSHAVLLKYHWCTSGRRPKNKMKYYLHNVDHCRCQLIVKSFGHSVQKEVKLHECCNICSTK